jgi:hypothetical protein
MFYIDPDKLVLLLLLAILVDILYCFIISLVVLIPPIRTRAQAKMSNRDTVTLILGSIVWLSVFIVITFWVSDTYVTTPPHGVYFGAWDDFDNERSGALFSDINTNAELIITGNVLDQISNERFFRYLLPPFLRYHCYTNSRIGCIWADIDVSNFDDLHEWFDYLLRMSIGLSSGYITMVLARKYLKLNDPLHS